jgi:hypothetical protein
MHRAMLLRSEEANPRAWSMKRASGDVEIAAGIMRASFQRAFDGVNRTSKRDSVELPWNNRKKVRFF